MDTVRSLLNCNTNEGASIQDGTSNMKLFWKKRKIAGSKSAGLTLRKQTLVRKQQDRLLSCKTIEYDRCTYSISCAYGDRGRLRLFVDCLSQLSCTAPYFHDFNDSAFPRTICVQSSVSSILILLHFETSTILKFYENCAIKQIMNTEDCYALPYRQNNLWVCYNKLKNTINHFYSRQPKS